MNRKWIFILLILIILSVAALAYLPTTFQAKETVPEHILWYAENQPEDYPTTLGAKKFAELVEERTDGRIKIIIMAEGKMGTEKEVIRQMQYGGIDFARVSLSQLAETLPQMNVLQMPYLYEDSEHMWRVLDGEIGERFLNYTYDQELVGLSWYDAGARNFYNSEKPIACLEDIKGMKIRVQESNLMADMIEALEAIAIQVSYEKVYSCLEQGLCDGAENNWPSYEAMRHYEVSEYFTVDEHTRVPEMQICSIHTWNSLSEEDRILLRECAEESAEYQRLLWVQQEEAAMQSAIKNGVTVVELTAEERARFRQKMSNIYEKYCSEYMDVIQQIAEEGNE